jgi:hypothetical protein
MDDNVFAYFSEFIHAAKQAGWPKERVDAVLEDARSDDYKHAREVIFAAWLETMGEQASPTEHVE